MYFSSNVSLKYLTEKVEIGMSRIHATTMLEAWI